MVYYCGPNISESDYLKTQPPEWQVAESHRPHGPHVSLSLSGHCWIQFGANLFSNLLNIKKSARLSRKDTASYGGSEGRILESCTVRHQESTSKNKIEKPHMANVFVFFQMFFFLALEGLVPIQLSQASSFQVKLGCIAYGHIFCHDVAPCLRTWSNVVLQMMFLALSLGRSTARRWRAEAPWTQAAMCIRRWMLGTKLDSTCDRTSQNHQRSSKIQIWFWMVSSSDLLKMTAPCAIFDQGISCRLWCRIAFFTFREFYGWGWTRRGCEPQTVLGWRFQNNALRHYKWNCMEVTSAAALLAILCSWINVNGAMSMGSNPCSDVWFLVHISKWTTPVGHQENNSLVIKPYGQLSAQRHGMGRAYRSHEGRSQHMSTASWVCPDLALVLAAVIKVKERPPTVLFLGLGFLLGRQVSIEAWLSLRKFEAKPTVAVASDFRFRWGHRGESRHFYMKLWRDEHLGTATVW